MLLAERSQALFDQGAERREVRDATEEETPEALPWRVEARRVVEPSDEGENFVQRDAHGRLRRVSGYGDGGGWLWLSARESSVEPLGCSAPPEGSIVTATPASGGGTRG